MGLNLVHQKPIIIIYFFTFIWKFNTNFEYSTLASTDMST